MLFFLISFSFLLLFAKPLSIKLFPSWVNELRLVFVLFCQEFLYYSLQWVTSCRLVRIQISDFSFAMACVNKKKSEMRVDNVQEEEAAAEMTILDLPELALECILGKLPPAGLCNMASVCRSLKDRCRSDHLWERHMREKWGRVMGRAAKREWELYVESRKNCLVEGGGSGKAKWWVNWMASVYCIWPCSWVKSKPVDASEARHSLPVDSVMYWYLTLESGRFWFPAQVYNRENGHVGFMLSCYDAELSYDSRTDTFHARYPPHGQKGGSLEDEVQWDKLRVAPVDTPAHELHISDCLNDLHPGDHIEIQWRKSKEFPYGWWYGVVGHLESCDGNEHYCHCHDSDTIILEFNQYTPGSRWRQTVVDRKEHLEEGNEIDGFYGGIRKLRTKDDISVWRRLWPAEVLE